MKVVFMGTPDFSVPTLQALVDAGYEVAGVFTQPDRPKGRGGKVQMQRSGTGAGIGRQPEIGGCGLVAQQRKPGKAAAFQQDTGVGKIRQTGQAEGSQAGYVGLKAQRRGIGHTENTEIESGRFKSARHVGGADVFRYDGGKAGDRRGLIGGAQRQIKRRPQPVRRGRGCLGCSGKGELQHAEGAVHRPGQIPDMGAQEIDACDGVKGKRKLCGCDGRGRCFCQRGLQTQIAVDVGCPGEARVQRAGKARTQPCVMRARRGRVQSCQRGGHAIAHVQ